MPRFLRPIHVLGAFCLGLLCFALTRTGHSAESVDVRTYVEMIGGVARHGVPYLENGAAKDFVGMRVPWNVVGGGGHYWPVYAPLYAYVSWPFFAAGGLPWVAKATTGVLVILALVTFAMTKRLVESEWHAVAAAILVVISTPVLGKSLEHTAYPLCTTLAATSVLLALVAIERTGRVRLLYAASAGLAGGLATSAHLLGFPMTMSLVAALAVCDASTESRLWPTRERLASSAAAFAGLLVPLVPMGLLNRMRFGTPSPFTYGPTPWRGSDLNGVVNQNVSAHLKFAMPVVLIVGLLVGVLWLTRRRRVLWIPAVLVTAVAAWFVPLLHERFGAYVAIIWGYLFDMSLLTLDEPYRRLPGQIGQFFGGFLAKSALQCTPVLFLAFVVGRRAPRTLHRVIVVLAPSAMLFSYLFLRANIPLHSALGFPWVYLRYTFPALPMALAASMLVVRDLAPTRTQWVATAALAAALVAFLGRTESDENLGHQIVLLVAPLALGAASAVLVVLHRRGKVARAMPLAAVTLTLALGVGSGLGHDLRANLLVKAGCDARLDAFAALTPQRFAVVGDLGSIDTVLALRATRDIEYADTYQITDWWQGRPMLERWIAEGRPIYVVGSLVSFWSDLEFKVLDEKQQFKVVVVKRPAP